MRQGVAIGCLVLVLAGLAAPARANFVISIGSASIPQGGTATIDVLLTSTADSASPDLLNNYGFTLQITGPNELLTFTSPPITGFESNSQYVFLGDSSGPNPAVSTTVYGGDTYASQDSTASGNPVQLSSTDTPKLLAVVSLDAAGITNVGDTYTVSLVPPTGNGSIAGNPPTFFDVFDFNTGGETSAVPFTSTPGTLTIVAAIPEPASLVSALAGVAVLAGVQGLRRLRHSKGQRV
jgi:hypothetical protein